jgi:hypothetical protein
MARTKLPWLIALLVLLGFAAVTALNVATQKRRDRLE